MCLKKIGAGLVIGALALDLALQKNSSTIFCSSPIAGRIPSWILWALIESNFSVHACTHITKPFQLNNIPWFTKIPHCWIRGPRVFALFTTSRRLKPPLLLLQATRWPFGASSTTCSIPDASRPSPPTARFFLGVSQGNLSEGRCSLVQKIAELVVK